MRPNLIDYVQSDCQMTERDKTMGGRQKYLLYDNLSFYNPIFSQYAEGKQKVGGVKPYQIDSLASTDLNRFNVDLVKEIGNID